MGETGVMHITLLKTPLIMVNRQFSRMQRGFELSGEAMEVFGPCDCEPRRSNAGRPHVVLEG